MPTFVFSGHRLRSARKAAGLRRERLAVAVDRSVASIALYETGSVDPPGTVIAGLASALDVRPGDLFDEVDR